MGQTKKKDLQGIIDLLLKNRGIKTKKDKEEFLNPSTPSKISAKTFGINPRELKKAILRIKKAKKTGERVIVYGDYDADGICGTAILWEALYKFGVNALPYIPERFSEGYGLNVESIKQLKRQDARIGLIITVDHGIVANRKIDIAQDLGIDVIIVDHHEPGKVIPKAKAVIHTKKIAGSGVAWVLSREFDAAEEALALVAIGTVADLVPVLGPNRTLLKYGIRELTETKRVGIVALCKEAAIDQSQIGTYQIGFIIAPRLNAMGRLEHAIDSLRLLCTKDASKAEILAQKLGKTNARRQEIVEKTLIHARHQVPSDEGFSLIFLAHEDYHEGIIGLAASRLVEEYYRPAIVASIGKEFSKASARSIPGFNIIEYIQSLNEFLIEGGGHSMAAGFTFETKHLDIVVKRFKELAKEKLTQDLLSPKLKIDCKLDFNQLNLELAGALQSFEPTGIGNPEPNFVTEKVFIEEARLVGQSNQHLKLWLTQPPVFDAIWFGMGSVYPTLSAQIPVDVVYSLSLDEWQGRKSLRLKIKDLREHGRY